MAVEGPPHAPFFTLSRFVHREVIVLLILCGVAIVAFLVTKASAAAARDLRVRDARTWYGRGAAHLEAGRVSEAVEALGRARALDRDEQAYHLAFAEALAAAGQPEAARQALLRLRETRPEDPAVNLGLAEIEAGIGNVPDAVRFYRSAVYGSWDPDRLDDRRRLRVRVIEYLIGQRLQRRAIAELLLLEADLPAEARPRLEAANLFLKAGDPARALAQYRRVLDLDPRNGEALSGAGRAAFALGDFAAARRYLARAPADAEGADEMRELAQAVLLSDPVAPRLSDAERRRRLAAGRAHVLALVSACRARVPPLAAATALAADEAALRRAAAAPAAGLADPEAFEAGVALVARAAAALPGECGPLDVKARAWALIGRAREGRPR